MKLFSSLLSSLGAVGLLILAATPAAQAQTGIGTLNPDASAALDISSSSKGLLIPRVALTGVNDALTIQSPANALMVYNTSPAIAGPGIYYNTGTSGAPNWERFVNSAAPIGLDFWRTLGNAGTTPGTHFIGTTDNQELHFKVNNIERLRMRPNGTTILTSDLEVKGKTTLAGDVKVTGNNSETTLRKTFIGLPSDRSELTVNGDILVDVASTSQNSPKTGGYAHSLRCHQPKKHFGRVGYPNFFNASGDWHPFGSRRWHRQPKHSGFSDAY